eukprot:gene17349-20646_t
MAQSVLNALSHFIPSLRKSEYAVETRELLGYKVVCISDTHGLHRSLNVPDGDILIHAGDFTKFGEKNDAVDFNEWLGTLPHLHKVVVNGNHESNANWKREVETILSNATFLRQSGITITSPGSSSVNIFGTEFFWPMGKGSHNPYFDQIPRDVDILVCHGPAKGYVDGGIGCPALTEIVRCLKPRLVVSGHVHGAHGIAEENLSVKFVNAANAGRSGHGKLEWDPIEIDL